MLLKQLLFASILFVHTSHAMEPGLSRMVVADDIGAYELTYGATPVSIFLYKGSQYDYFGLFKRHVKKWLAKGALINCPSPYLNEFTPRGEYTPLSYAAMEGSVRKCEILLELGADVNGVEANLTPLAVVRRYCPPNSAALCTLFLAHGADINIRSKRTGKTALMAAIEGGNSVVDLLKLGADPLIADFDGNNALMYAARMHGRYPNRYHAIDCLLEFCVRSRSLMNNESLFTFLCCLKRVLRTGNQHERGIAASLYSNRKIFIVKCINRFPPLRDVLALVNYQGGNIFHQGRNAFQLNENATLCQYPWLDPDNAQATEKELLERIQAQRLEASARLPEQRGCAIQ